MAKRKFYYIAGIYGGVEVMKRTVFAILFMILLATEILIGMYATGWVRSYLGDVLVVILLYAFARMMSSREACKKVHIANSYSGICIPRRISAAVGILRQIWYNEQTA